MKKILIIFRGKVSAPGAGRKKKKKKKKKKKRKKTPTLPALLKLSSAIKYEALNHRILLKF